MTERAEAAFGQGVSIDDLLEGLRASKDEIRKDMLQRYMEALDESEGLQAITARLCERLGVGEQPHVSDLHSSSKCLAQSLISLATYCQAMSTPRL